MHHPTLAARFLRFLSCWARSRTFSLLAYAAVFSVLATLGCDDESTPSYTLESYTPQMLDASYSDTNEMRDAVPLRISPPEDICALGAMRCRANRTDLIERCGVPEESLAQATRWIPDRCPEGEVCLDGACGPFSCVPGRPTCNGLSTLGICTETGDAITDTETCQDDAICRGGQCIDLCQSAEQNRSHVGCEYVTLALPNPLLDLDEPFGVIVANPSSLISATISLLNRSGEPETLILSKRIAQLNELVDEETMVYSSVEDGDGNVTLLSSPLADDIIIPPNGLATLLLDRAPYPHDASGIYNTAKRLVSSVPVVAYQFNPYCCSFSFTNDATILLPTHTLGTQYTAVAPPDWDIGGLSGGVAVVASSQEETILTITVPESAKLAPFSADSERSFTFPANERVWSLPLRAGQTLHLASDLSSEQSWLTGLQIEGDQPFSVFSTHSCTNIPHPLPACDHLETQLIPNSTWGRRYILPMLVRRSFDPKEVVYWHFVAGAAGAQITFGVPLELRDTLIPFSAAARDCFYDLEQGELRTITLAPNSDCIFGTSASLSLESNNPISVLGYMVGERAATLPCGDAPYCASGDPSMFLVPPIDQYRTSYAFLTPETYAFDFVSIMLPAQSMGKITLDGKAVDLSTDSVAIFPLSGSDYIVAHLPIEDGAHVIEANAPFGLLVYAYDRYVSYAYAGGLNLTKRQ